MPNSTVSFDLSPNIQKLLQTIVADEMAKYPERTEEHCKSTVLMHALSRESRRRFPEKYAEMDAYMAQVEANHGR